MAQKVRVRDIPEASKDLLAKLRSRDATVLEEIFKRNNPLLVRMLAANGIRAEAAEDLVHQTWERFFTNLDRFEGRSELRTFLCGILLNQIREHRRALGRLDLEEDSELVVSRAFSLDGWWNVPPTDPSRLYDSVQLSELIGECLGGLTELQKAAFVLKEVEQEDSPAICNVLGVSVSNLRVLIFRAKDKLRQCLEGKLGESERGY